jgi:hypothetical protein
MTASHEAHKWEFKARFQKLVPAAKAGGFVARILGREIGR